MNILIIGCGRVGTALAEILSQKGHDVALLDKNKSALEAFESNYSGLLYCGIPIDNDVLREAGISSCDAVCAVTDEENTNIMVSEIAKTVFNVPLVLTRVFDSIKGDIFKTFNLHTICSTKLTVDALCDVLDKYENTQYLKFDDARFKFYTFDIPEEYIGMKAFDIDYEEGEILYAILRGDKTIKLVNNSNIELVEGDRLVLSRVVT